VSESALRADQVDGEIVEGNWNGKPGRVGRSGSAVLLLISANNSSSSSSVMDGPSCLAR